LIRWLSGVLKGREARVPTEYLRAIPGTKEEVK
jgi:hypothetical protein